MQHIFVFLHESSLNNLKVIHVRTLVSNSDNKIRKCTNVKYVKNKKYIILTLVHCGFLLYELLR